MCGDSKNSTGWKKHTFAASKPNCSKTNGDSQLNLKMSYSPRNGHLTEGCVKDNPLLGETR